jgi:hypothetical protein
MTAPRPTSQPAPVSERPRLRLVVVPTPQPPLEDERQPVRLVLPGIVPPARCTGPAPDRGWAPRSRGSTTSGRPGRRGRPSPTLGTPDGG